MRLPLVRFTLRMLMVSVAAVALLMGFEMMRRRRAEFERLSALHRRHLLLLGRWEWFDVAAQRAYEEEQARTDPRKAWHLRMADKYRLAAERPWLVVAPDSSPP
jgi:hypothetical protein